MDLSHFDAKFHSLLLLSGSFETDELFLKSYLDLMQEVQTVDIGKYQLLSAMKEILAVQVAFIVAEYLEAMTDDKMPEVITDKVGWIV